MNAEDEGFEPSIPCGIPPFQGGAINHYANPPIIFIYHVMLLPCLPQLGAS